MAKAVVDDGDDGKHCKRTEALWHSRARQNNRSIQVLKAKSKELAVRTPNRLVDNVPKTI